MKTTTVLQRSVYPGILLCLAAGTAAYAQVTTINSAMVTSRVWNDIPGASFSSSGTYPSLIQFSEFGVSAASGFANRDVWQFSSDGGASAYQLQNNDYFHASFDLKVTGSPISPRKEAGFLLSTTGVGDIQLIVNTDGHEVVQFGGISFYSFSGASLVSYNSGDTINLGMHYFLAGDGNNALQFYANGNASPVYEFAPGFGIGNGSTLGGYFQIVNDSANPFNSGIAAFQNINIVPEPSTLALLSLGVLPLGLLLRRHQAKRPL